MVMMAVGERRPAARKENVVKSKAAQGEGGRDGRKLSQAKGKDGGMKGKEKIIII